jgi:DHA1 family tetracycline resistance protein-like MFS transporter
LSLANWLYGFFFVPESLPLERRKAFTLRRANPVGSLVLLRSHPELFQLATIQFIGYLAHEVFNVWALYAIYRYAWSAGSIGTSLALAGICTAVISAGLVRPIVARIGERRTLYLGQFFGGLGVLMAGLARTGAIYLGSIPIISIWNISSPAANGMMTHRVSESEQGELQGAISSLRAIAMMLGPGLFTFTFAFFIDPKTGWNVPGAPWYLGAFLLFIAAAMSTRIPRVAAETEPATVVPPG